jgi:hypothetical protein
MLRRLATVLLIAAVTFAGVIACPRGGACCIRQAAAPPEVAAAAHDCCAKGPALRASDCCNQISAVAPRALNAATKIVHSHGMIAAADAAPTGVLPVASPCTVRSGQDRGLAPPGTLTGQHTSLLL